MSPKDGYKCCNIKKQTIVTMVTMIRGWLDVPLPTYPYEKSIKIPDLSGVFMASDPQQLLETVHPSLSLEEILLWCWWHWEARVTWRSFRLCTSGHRGDRSRRGDEWKGWMEDEGYVSCFPVKMYSTEVRINILCIHMYLYIHDSMIITVCTSYYIHVFHV